jgi:hypothetical protein
MCINCGDWIDSCAQDGCYDPDGGPYGQYRQFYIDAEYCEHLKAHYGHDRAEWRDRYGDE